MTKPMNMILTFLAGTLAGFLFAPEKGVATRKTISETARRMKTSLDKARSDMNRKVPVA